MRRVVALASLVLVVLFVEAQAQWKHNGLPVLGGNELAAAVPDGSGGVILMSSTYARRVNSDGSMGWSGQVQFGSGNSAVATSDGSGGAIVAWLQPRAYAYDVVVQRISADGTLMWPTGGVGVTTDNVAEETPQIVNDGSGGAIVAFATSNGYFPNHNIYAIHVDSSGSISWGGVSVPLTTAPEAQYSPVIASDEAGGAIVAWTDLRNESVGDIYAQRITAAGIVMWQADGVPLCVALGSQSYVSLISDQSGGATAIWHDYRLPSSKVFAQRVAADGSAVWTPNGVRVCALSSAQFGPAAVAGPAGSTTVAWSDDRNANSDLYVQRIDGSGSTLWTDVGIPVCTALSAQTTVSICATSDGGNLIAWLDDRFWQNAGYQNVFVDKLSSNGELASTEGGTALSVALGNSFRPLVTASNAGAIVAWGGYYYNSAQSVFAQGVSDEYYMRYGLSAARPSSAIDVPNDQGGKITVRWQGSPFDGPVQNPVTHYSVWRSVASSAAIGPAVSSPEHSLSSVGSKELWREATSDGVRYWEWLGDIPAVAFDHYSYTAATLNDSTTATTAINEFQVVTHGIEYAPQGFIVSARQTVTKSGIVSGYSVDNLAPTTPQGLAGRFEFSTGTLAAHWHPNHESDLREYRVYRGIGSDFVPTTANLVAAPRDTLLTGLQRLDSPWHLKVSAVDIHGNQSGFALLAPTPPVATLFSDFSAHRSQTGVHVNWTLSSESDGILYDVWKTHDAQPWISFPVSASKSGNEYSFDDANVEPALSYRYRVDARLGSTVIASFEVLVPASRLVFSLGQNYPNPFNPRTTIEFELTTPGSVSLTVYTASGERVRTIMEGVMPAGHHSLVWDGTNAHGDAVSSGVYFCRLHSTEGDLTRRMVLLK